MSMGIPPMYFVAMVQTLNVNFVIPAQPTLLFAVNLDETGRTTYKLYYSRILCNRYFSYCWFYNKNNIRILVYNSISHINNVKFHENLID